MKGLTVSDDERATKKRHFDTTDLQKQQQQNPIFTLPGVGKSRKRAISEISEGYGSEQGVEHKSDMTMKYEGGRKFRKLNYSQNGLSDCLEEDDEADE